MNADQKGSKHIIILIVSLTLIIACGCWQLINAFLPECDSHSIPLRKTETIDGFEAQWALTEVFVPASEQNTHIMSNDQHLIT
ncbi:hypothetical protein [Vibrio sp.]|uniref:hypothetical protein n=1 Tax=Vibrio sp. TaxID=678 RepID=UPI003D102759